MSIRLLAFIFLGSVAVLAALGGIVAYYRDHSVPDYDGTDLPDDFWDDE